MLGAGPLGAAAIAHDDSRVKAICKCTVDALEDKFSSPEDVTKTFALGARDDCQDKLYPKDEDENDDSRPDDEDDDKEKKSATEEKVRAFVNEHSLTYPIGKEDGGIARLFNVSGIPAAAVVKDGEFVWRGHPNGLSEACWNKWLN